MTSATNTTSNWRNPADLSAALHLYLVTDPVMCANNGRGVIDTVIDAIDGGVTIVQLRDKRATDADFYRTACALHEAIDGCVPLIINDRVEIASRVGAEGVHVGQRDISSAAARALLGDTAILGVSVTNAAELAAVDTDHVDYIGIGPVFATTTKPDHAPPIGIEGVRQLWSARSLPAVAIGGLQSQHVSDLRATGISGIAVVSAICAAHDPTVAAQSLSRQHQA